jgi:anti-sigma regulatory factor (Ser/Thr protein kinase)
LELSRSFPLTPLAASEARRSLAELALDARVARDLELVVSELVTNSVEHSGVGPEGSVRLNVELDANRVLVEVLDEGSGFNAEDREAHGTDERGRGLLLVDRLASRWGVGYGPGTRVWAELALRPSGDARGPTHAPCETERSRLGRC